MIKLKNLIKETTQFRENIGGIPLQSAAERLAKTLFNKDIPHYVIGGYALQEYGYHRNTIDIDIIIPNREETISYLSINGYKKRVTGNKMKVVERQSGIEIDILEGGEKLSRNSKVPLPIPTIVKGSPNPLNLCDLINIKLDSYINNANRLKDGDDVGRLIIIHKLPLDLYKKLNVNVRDGYVKLWRDYNNIDR